MADVTVPESRYGSAGVVGANSKIDGEWAGWSGGGLQCDPVAEGFELAGAKGAIWASIWVSTSAMSASRASMRASILANRKRSWSVKYPTNASSS
jgi:hypothetical protein